MNILIISIVLILFFAVVAVCILGLVLSKKDFFCAFPRTIADGDPNKLRYIHLNGFFFVISNDLWGKDIVYQNEASNMMFQYNLKPSMNASEILNSNKPLNIEMLDVITNKQMSYTVPHNSKAQAIRFFTKYRELMNRINQHKMTSN